MKLRTQRWVALEQSATPQIRPSLAMAALQTATALDYALLVCALFYVVACPFTKVEESFGLQAAHDVLFWRHDVAAYDHNEFPGVVPRSFLGPLALALASSPAAYTLLYALGASKMAALYAVRMVLATAAWGGVTGLRAEVTRRFSAEAGTCFVLLSMTQFHLLFYMGRTLPNTFAMLGVLLGVREVFREEYELAFFALTLSGVVLRAEVALLLGVYVVLALVKRRVSLKRTLGVGLVGAAVALVATVGVDSVFWGRWLWPEGEVFWFNAVDNRSSEWGVSPAHWYCTLRASVHAPPLTPAHTGFVHGLFGPLRDCLLTLNRAA